MIVECLTRSEIIERLTTLKAFIEEHKISVYEKKANNLIRKIFDCWDNNNTVGVVIYANNVIKIEGEDSLLKESIISILNKKNFSGGEFDYFHHMNKGG